MPRRNIAITDLHIAATNVRHTSAGAEADTELRASILAHGLIQPLVVIDSPENGFDVIAGGRRLTALKALVANKDLPAGYKVPCELRTADAATEISLAENMARVPMHPADQVAAFRELAQSGRTTQAIAARFGVSERTVERRLALGSLHPEILELYRTDQIDQQTAQIFTLAPDQDRQIEILHRLDGRSAHVSAQSVRHLLTQDAHSASSPIARFVGLTAYENAGGRVSRDLFNADRDTMLLDIPVLECLALARLKTEARDLSQTWSWATPVLHPDYYDIHRNHMRLSQPDQPLSAQEREELDRLHRQLNRLHDRLDLGDHDDRDALIGEIHATQEQLDTLNAAIDLRIPDYPPEHRAHAGCIVTVSQEGFLQILHGLVKPGDIHHFQNAGNASPAASSDGASTATPDASSHSPSTRQQSTISHALAHDLAQIRTAVVRASLAGHFDQAFDLLLFQMARSLLTPSFANRDVVLDARFHSVDLPAAEERTPRLHETAEDRSHLALDWVLLPSTAEAFRAMSSLGQGQKQAIFATCVGLMLRPRLASDHAAPQLEAAIGGLGIDFAAELRPTATNFWSRLTKPHILAIAEEVLGEDWANARRTARKAELVSMMEHAFAAKPDPGLTADQHAAANDWSFPGFMPVGHDQDPT